MHTLLSSFERQEQLGLKKKSSLTYVNQPSLINVKKNFPKHLKKTVHLHLDQTSTMGFQNKYFLTMSGSHVQTRMITNEKAWAILNITI